MQSINRLLLTALVFILVLPAGIAQTIGNRADLVNKTWRIMAMKCPDALSNAGDPDQYVHYYGTLTLTPAAGNAQSVNYGTYVRVNRDASDNPVEKGTYSLVTDEMNGTKLVLKPKKGNEMTYRVETVLPNHLTLINLGEDVKCKFTYAIVP
jgi:hypothetical protein